ncbi:MAG: tetratricopeptide repeat protein [Deltaproteobacteria bacterium]|nr:tetratricopeptide repeat protein [Deltaproteobacteria bacterium]
MKRRAAVPEENKMAALRLRFAFLLSLCVSTLLLCSPLLAAAQSSGAAVEHAQRGEAMLSQGNWEEAIKELSAALRLDPNRADVHANLGMAYYFKGNSVAAVPEFQAALRADQERVDAVHGLGLALYDQGDLEEAIAAFRTSSRQNPMAYFNLGNALEQKGDYTGAVEAYKNYLAAAPPTPETAALRNALSKETSPTPAAGTAREHFQRGQALLDKKDAPGAVAAFLAALRLKPNYVEACNGLGLAFRAGGDLDEAIAGYQMALRLDAKFGAAHRNLAQAFEEKGDRLPAAQAYDRYLLLVPGAADAAQVRAKIARLRGGGQ